MSRLPRATSNPTPPSPPCSPRPRGSFFTCRPYGSRHSRGLARCRVSADGSRSRRVIQDFLPRWCTESDTDAALFCAAAGARSRRLGGRGGGESGGRAGLHAHLMRVLITALSVSPPGRIQYTGLGLASFACDSPFLRRSEGSHTQSRSAPSARVSVTASACDGGPSPQSKRSSASAWRQLHARVCQ